MCWFHKWSTWKEFLRTGHNTELRRTCSKCGDVASKTIVSKCSFQNYEDNYTKTLTDIRTGEEMKYSVLEGKCEVCGKVDFNTVYKG